ncbi:MAG TPA: Si-specific NAD(P)(+) transhydrogenase [Planctomycetota bacterium]|nr:Si-specific NAD(P)(+) transhydrogenase [Planctomycetota bacterium]
MNAATAVPTEFDVVIIGGGPAGHGAALHAARHGQRTLLIERETSIGGACVTRGTIPSKTLRETALAFTGFKRKSADVCTVSMGEDVQVASLMMRLEQVVTAHQASMSAQLARAEVVRWHGRARFIDAHTVAVTGVDRSIRPVRARFIIIATGSRPRTPPEIPIDHARILDSDSILSLTYLPHSLTVLGAGVIACEYASIFAALGTQVTIIDRNDRPLGFLDPELTTCFTEAFTATGSRFIGKAVTEKVEWDGLGDVVTTLAGGEEVRSEKLLCTLGRVANLEDLDLPAAGLAPTPRGLLPVDKDLRTSATHIYGVGDVIGPPSLASASMDQGRRAVCHALGLPSDTPPEMIPMGIYAIPELSSVGLTEDDARKRHGGALVGRARFSELARGQIAAIQDGLLKLVTDAEGKKLLGVQVVGEGAAELVAIGQMALIAGMDVDVFIANTFNFPTLAEAYRLAAMDVVFQRETSAANRPAVVH